MSPTLFSRYPCICIMRSFSVMAPLQSRLCYNWCIQRLLHHQEVNDVESYHSDIINKMQLFASYTTEAIFIGSIMRYDLIDIGVSSKGLPREDVLQSSLVILLSYYFVENICLACGILSLMAYECGCRDKYEPIDNKLLEIGCGCDGVTTQ
eukprot:826297_1